MLWAVVDISTVFWACIPIVALFTGGLAGAWYNAYRARLQPISYVLKTQKLFGDHQAAGELHLSVVAYDPATSLPDPEHFDHLFLVEVEIVNSGNRDFEAFNFGITFNDADRILFCQHRGSDRHHLITSSSRPTVTIPAYQLDFVCTPFNRRDSYSITLYVAPATNETAISHPKVTSVHPVKMKMAPDTSELLVNAAGSFLSVVSPSLGFSIRLK